MQLIRDDPDLEEGIPLAVLEFDDRGILHDRALKDEVMARLRALTEEEGTLTVVFTHGWLNDASAKSPSFVNFRQMLQRIARADRAMCAGRSCSCRRVVGVYIGWRGRSLRGQPMGLLSFWNRKSRAHRVGQAGLTEILAELAEAKAGRTPGWDRENACGNPKGTSRLVVLGHSFGGAMVYTATQQLLQRDAASQDFDRRTGQARSVPRTAADLLILINPAFEAGRFTSLHDRAETMEFPDSQSPILAVFTAENDWATKRAFPAGRRFSTLFNRYNPRHPGQARRDRKAIGHYSDYLTHDLCPRDPARDLASRAEAVCEWERFRRGETDSWDLGTVVLERRDADRRTNPYYNVRVDRDILSGHSGIWQPDDFMQFVSRLVTVQLARPCQAYLRDYQPPDSPPASCRSD